MLASCCICLLGLPQLWCCDRLCSDADKGERMRAAIKYYLEGDEHALDRFPGGSEPGS